MPNIQEDIKDPSLSLTDDTEWPITLFQDFMENLGDRLAAWRPGYATIEITVTAEVKKQR